jgi:hypothetical protein
MIYKQKIHFVLISAVAFFTVLAALANQNIKDGDVYKISNLETKEMLRPKGASWSNGAVIVTYNPKDWDCLTWTFTGNLEEGFKLQNHYTHKSMGRVGDHLEQVEINSSSALVFESSDDGNWRIRVEDTNLYLTSTGKDGIVKLEPMQNSTRQSWVLE